MKKRAFTLVELMVVLGIIALLSAIIFGAFSSVREGNKRGSCQGNLNQIYAAARLYSQDNDGQFPYLNANIADDSGSSSNKAPDGGAGLWSLYVYAVPTSTNNPFGLPLSNNDGQLPSNGDPRPAAILASYLKGPRAFHCPSDNFDKDLTYATLTGIDKITLSSAQIDFVGSDNRRHLNPYYLSYQGPDYQGPDAQPTGKLFSTFRRSNAKRQLSYYNQLTPSPNGTVQITPRRAPDQTVVTYCRFHRSLTTDGFTKQTDFSRTFDNVLFLDGSVQSVPVEQTVTLGDGSASATCRGWKRVPLAEANAVPQYVIDACNSTP